MHEDSLQVFTEFCTDHPEMLNHMYYTRLKGWDEPVPILDTVALDAFRVWEFQRAYVAAQATRLGRIMWWLWCVWMMRPLG